MKPVEFSFLTRQHLGTHYEYVCEVAHLEATEDGWGLLHCVRDNGDRVTAVTNDVPYLQRMAKAKGGDVSGFEITAEKFPLSCEGWPDDWVGRRLVSTPRNDPCPCRSGRKYKYCHGRPSHVRDE